MKFSHIAPKRCLTEGIKASQIHMALFHLTDDEEYCAHYRNAPGDVILDNSWFELGQCPSVESMLIAAAKVQADYVVLEDGTLNGLEVFKAQGYKVLAVPAGIDTQRQFEAWVQRDDIDLVALSFTHASRAVGLRTNNPSSRFAFMNSLSKDLVIPKNKIHMLGMTDSVHEVLLMRPWWPYINSWDSSSAVWNGIQGIDVSAMKTKNSLSVDFDIDAKWSIQCTRNIQYIHSLTQV